jgi:hypothetical protein
VRRFVIFLAERGIVQRPTAITADAPDQRVLEFQEWLQAAPRYLHKND